MSVFFFSFMGAVFGGLTVAIGAFGAHALKDVLNQYGLSLWNKAVFYQAVHSLTLLTLPLFSDIMTPRAIGITGLMFISGVMLFSGSLYLLAVTGVKAFGAVTPLGGIAFIVGWVWLSSALFKAAFLS